MRALFLATPNLTAARVLWRWLEAGHEVAGFWHPGDKSWRQDRRIGLLNPHWSVSAALRRHGIASRAVPPPSRAEPELLAQAGSLGADVLICCYFTHRITPRLLDLFGPRAVNFHPALLPAYRGPLPTLAMMLAGETHRHGGMTLHVLSPEMDAGDIVAATPVPGATGATLLQWRLALARAAGELAAGPLPAFLDGATVAQPQAGPSSYINTLPMEWVEIDRRWSCQRVRETLRRLGSQHPLRVAIDEERVTVKGFVRRVGPPTGQPLQRSRRRLTLDVADGRIVLATRGRYKIWQSLRELLTVARAPL
ncbi:MAG: formyltransferase family protein [Gallionellaceae bacterium]|nr:formyltransferase family protein [Gallionellaceae bacterium]